MNRARPSSGIAFILLAIAVLFAVLARLQTRIDQQTRTVAEEKEELLFTSGSVAKKLSLGYEALLADIYWTRAVQYYGGGLGEMREKFELLWPLLDLTTTLDPQLVVAYRFGAIFLSEPPPIGAGQTERAIELVQRGIRENPTEWRLGSDLGFLYFWHLHDYADAANAYLEASQNPEAPEWVSLMAARMADRGDALETSKLVWSQIYQTTTNKSIRAAALQHLEGLEALEDERHLDALSEEFRKNFGRYPSSLEELRDKGYLQGIPVDPRGFAYQLGKDGKARLDPRSKVPTERVPSDTQKPPTLPTR
jgi:tetratricopeptide (TPR) repeat protein